MDAASDGSWFHRDRVRPRFLPPSGALRRAAPKICKKNGNKNLRTRKADMPLTRQVSRDHNRALAPGGVQVRWVEPRILEIEILQESAYFFAHSPVGNLRKRPRSFDQKRELPKTSRTKKK